MSKTRRDRLRTLLDAVLDEQHRTLEEMSGGAHASPFHFSRQLSRDAREAPVAMRRRVMLERAAWRLGRGASVTDAAWEAGYESVEGFSRAFARAFGHPPSVPAAGHWLPAPNGIHFHPPTSLWVRSQEQPMNPLVEQMIEHDLDDTRLLIEAASAIPEDEFRATRMPGLSVLEWDGPEESLARVLERHIAAKEVWVAAIEGADFPDPSADPDAAALLARHDAIAPRWLAVVRDIERRGAWDDRLIDALCDPPESFVMSSVIAHVLTYAAHRRQLARLMLVSAGGDVAPGGGDPINWFHARRGETEGEA